MHSPFKRQSHRETRERATASIHFFTTPRLQQPGLGQARVVSLELHASLPHGCRGPRTWTIFCCFFRNISRELDRRWWPGLDPEHMMMTVSQAVDKPSHHTVSPRSCSSCTSTHHSSTCFIWWHFKYLF